MSSYLDGFEAPTSFTHSPELQDRTSKVVDNRPRWFLLGLSHSQSEKISCVSIIRYSREIGSNGADESTGVSDHLKRVNKSHRDS